MCLIPSIVWFLVPKRNPWSFSSAEPDKIKNEMLNVGSAQASCVCGYWATESCNSEAIPWEYLFFLSQLDTEVKSIQTKNHITCPDIHLMHLLLLLLLNPRILPLQRVDICGHAFHHHTVESCMVFTSTGIDCSWTQLGDVIRPQALLFIQFCAPGERHKDTVSRRFRKGLTECRWHYAPG